MMEYFRGNKENSAKSDARLREMGYNPKLKRSWRRFTNAAVTISAMSVLLSVTSSFGTALTYGGPSVIVWGWVFVSFCSICVALGMAELSSAYPTSGGMYYWIYQLLGPEHGRFVCWVTGWLNLLGQIASLASSHYYAVTLIQTFVLLSTGTARPPVLSGDLVSPEYADQAVLGEATGFIFTPQQTLGMYAGMLVLTASINTFGGRVMVYVTEFAAWWHIAGVTILIIAVPCIATQHQSAEWVFRQYESDLGNDAGISNKFYIGILGLLLPAYCYTGYDGPAHMAEESFQPELDNPVGIMQGVYFMAIFGWLWVISLLFSVSDRLYVLGAGNITPEADGDVVPQILWDAFQQRTGRGKDSLALLIIPLLGVVFCSLSTLTYVSRIMFAYSRDNAVPLSWIWVKLDKRQQPVFAIWGAAGLAFIIALPSLKNALAFQAIVALSTTALNFVYVAPSLVRITFGRHRFVPGPWNLGKWAYPVNIIASLWVGFCVVIFSLPTEYPVNSNTNLNYAGITMLAVFALSVIWYWFPFYGGYSYFKGPVPEIIVFPGHHDLGLDGKQTDSVDSKSNDEPSISARDKQTALMKYEGAE